MAGRLQVPAAPGRMPKSISVDEEFVEVDWNTIEDELQHINPVWKEPRFDSLPHVVEVLTSRDPQVSLRSLCKQRDSIEYLVDDVVRGYHSGFNKAIHNYSQILRYFSLSSTQIADLKNNLAESRSRLGVRHKQLFPLWYRSITLRNILTLLDLVESTSQIPARVEKLIAGRRYYAAVQTLHHSVLLMEKEGIQNVGALREVKAELQSLQQQLFDKTLDDLQHHLYNKGIYSAKDKDCLVNDEDISDIPVVLAWSAQQAGSASQVQTHSHASGSQIHGQSQPHAARTEKSARVKPRSMRRSPSEAKGLMLDLGRDEHGREEEEQPNSPESEHSSRHDIITDVTVKRFTQSTLPAWLEESNSDGFVETLSKSDAPTQVKYLQTMVEILAMLGRLNEAGGIICQKLRSAVRERIVAEIKAKKEQSVGSEKAVTGGEPSRPRGAAAARPAARAAVPGTPAAPPRLTKSQAANAAVIRDGASSLASSPLHASQLAAQSLLEDITAMLLRVLENHVTVGEMMEKRAAVGGSGSTAAPGSLPVLGGYSVPLAWSAIQSEVQQLICDILRVNPDGSSADATAARVANLRIANGASDNQLAFSFRFSEHASPQPGAGESLSAALGGDGLFHASAPPPAAGAGGGAAAVGLKKRIALLQEGYGTAAILSERGIYLTSACYRPVLQFTDRVCKVLPHHYAELGRHGLRPFIDSSVKDHFLPSVHVDYRARLADFLAAPGSFRPRAREGAVYADSVEEGRPVLQGPLAVERLIGELLLWAQAMPVYAAEFLALVQTLLERTLEKCKAVFTEAVLGSASNALMGLGDMEEQMRRQPAILLIDEPAQRLTAQDIEQAGEDPQPETYSFNLHLSLTEMLWKTRPLRYDSIIADNNRLLLIAALSDTLEHLADSILLLGQTQERASGHHHSRHGRGGHHGQGQLRPASAAGPPVPALPGATAGAPPASLTSGLTVLAAKYRGLARECLRTLRVEMSLHAMYHLQGMEDKSYVNDFDADEPEEFIMALNTELSRLNEDLEQFVAPPRKCYILGGVSALAATVIIKSLPLVTAINSFGVRQIQRNCVALRQTLEGVNASSALSLTQCFDRVSEYYDLLNRPFDAVLMYVQDHGGYFSKEEYFALLKAKVPGREIPPEAASRVEELLS